ncbi:MAG: methylated-DNA--[protein]-cysteine S-methyltransferase [Cyanobacteria bacterium P01_D01_bin.73]
MTEIQFTVLPCWLGKALIAATSKGICAIALDGSAEVLTANLKTNFPDASLIPGDGELERSIQPIIEFIEHPQPQVPFPLDMQGTDFQKTVWRALLAISPGETITYTELAQRMGKPNSVRAVANACGKNRIAIAIPCHRVVGSDGSLRGYRWGESRKQLLLEKEQQNSQNPHQLNLLDLSAQ